MVVWSSRIEIEKEELRERGFHLKRRTKKFAFVCEQKK
jgi:hypothetical protein